MPITINWFLLAMKFEFTNFGLLDHTTFNIVEMTKKLTFDEVISIIQSDNSTQLNELIRERGIVDINMRDLERTKSLLMATCQIGSISCAKVLIDNNADINDRVDENTALKCACLSGNVQMLQFVIEHGFVINDCVLTKLFEIESILVNTDIATELILHVVDVNYQGPRGTYEEGSLLLYACRYGNITIVRMLLERGADRSLISSVYGSSLEVAARHGHTDIVELLLDWDAADSRPIPRDSLNTALREAAIHGNVSTARRLIAAGVDPSALDLAMYEANKYDRPELGQLLLDSGLDVNAMDSSGGYALLHACSHHSTGMVQLLLARGADPNAVDERGDTSLRAAELYPDILLLLLEHGADPNLVFYDGLTVLFDIIGRHNSSIESLSLLLQHGADPNQADASGETPLYVGAVARRVDYVRVLLEHGADVTQVIRDGKCLLELLTDPKYSKVVELCLQYVDSNRPGAKAILK